jgi:tRNA-2-methylthio-N6-dimethylallyladenosine synthase
MHRFHVWTIGCQMNVAESVAITLALRKHGLQHTAVMDDADLVIINSCTVRESAEQRVQGQLAALARRKQTDPDLMIALTGCSVEPDLSAMEEKLPMVDFFFRPGALEHFLTQLEAQEVIGLPLVHDAMMGYEAPVATYLTVMQGCNKFCTYCIVPYRRGRERSRPIAEVRADAVQFVARGVKEITLLGQNIDSYGRDLPRRSHLAELLEAVDAVPGLERVRFMTSHPRDMDQRLIDAVAGLPHVCEQIHVAIQAGDDQVLRRMRRGYTGQSCIELVERIRRTVPGVGLSTDVIVGFPGETEEQFQRTLAVLEACRFDVVHTACYSPREGTVSATWEDDVPQAIKEDRRRRVEARQEQIARARHEAQVGSVVEVLVEDTQSARRDVPQWRGRTRAGTLVYLPRDREDLRGTLVAVRVEKASAWALQGSPVQAAVAGVY